MDQVKELINNLIAEYPRLKNKLLFIHHKAIIDIVDGADPGQVFTEVTTATGALING